MAKIKILSPNVYNRIAAGEVIERPCGAVKELVENSVDAGATRIVIEVEGGGFGLISVSDNGIGIHREDVALAFVKHATSKLESDEQLAAIDTLGFRGEALASIASVSRVTLTTRTSSDDEAVRVTLEEGVEQSRQYLSANVGTKIEVRDLFYNTPARKKFFKSVGAEATEITKYVARLIFANSTLEITYILDGKTVYSTKGNGLEEAIFTVYGNDCLQNCIKVQFKRGDTRITGYIGNPEYTKANKSYQLLSVNNRCVVDAGISGAIMQAYKPFLMTKRFPFYILDLAIPSDLVDVNVHPKKSEVRFAFPREVCGACYYCVTEALSDFTRQQSQQTFLPGGEKVEPPKMYSQREFLDVFNKLAEDGELDIMNRDQAADYEEMEEATEQADRKKTIKELGEILEREITVDKARHNMGLDDPNNLFAQDVITIDTTAQPAYVPTREDLLFNRIRILGAAFKTYLILEFDDKLVLVDQHAAHERILYDKFMLARNSDMQPVMFPYVFTASDEESQFIENNLDNILSAGVSVEPFGKNTFRIVAVSPLLADMKMEQFVQFMLASDDFRLDDRTLIVEALAKKACKAAVKAGDPLNEYEIKYILKQICDNNILQCPHGRPITYTVTRTQLEKLFKRIV